MPPERLEAVQKVEGEHIQEKNLMQIELGKRYFNGDMNSEKFMNEWIPKYSAKFRELFEKEIDENPNFFEDLADPLKRENILLKFEELLYRD